MVISSYSCGLSVFYLNVWDKYILSVPFCQAFFRISQKNRLISAHSTRYCLTNRA